MGDCVFGGLPGPAEDGLNAALREFVESRTLPLYDMMSYQLGWGREEGEAASLGPPPRLHGGLALAAAYASGGDYQPAINHAISVEMMNSFWLIHNDIEDGNTERAGRPSVWWHWGPAQAINAGDGMHALARLTMLDLQRRGLSADLTFRAMQALDRASLQMCEGRFRDMEAQERIDMSVDGYLEMARAKSGSLLSGAMRLGALIGSGGDEAAADAFGTAGEELGVAMQAAGDDLDLFGGEDGGALSEEVLNKKKLLPVVYAIAGAGPSERRRLGDVYFKRVLEPADVAEVRSLVLELGGRERAREVAAQHRRAALGALGSLDLADGGAAVVEAFADAVA